MKKYTKYISLLLLILFYSESQSIGSDKVIVDVNFDLKHNLGDISTFDRTKFVTIHANITEQEWDGDNFTSDLRDDFLVGYDVYLGRDTGGITWWLNSQIKEDPLRSGFASPDDISTFGQNVRNSFGSRTALHSFESRNDQILCAQLHPFWPDGQLTLQGWAFSQTDTQGEPFGTATGEYMARYMTDFYGTGGVTGAKRPNYVEIINEPLWHLVDYGDEHPEKIFKFHNTVAEEIRKRNENLVIGGYCTAFPDHENDNFKEWEERWKLFMDVSGEHMDFWTIHLYDFPSINNGKELYRKGSNMEATFDIMEQYSYMKFGEVKPFMISEYGAQMHDYFGTWSRYRDWLHVKSVNSMMMQFMERANIINKTINFLIVKAEWGTTGVNDTYNHRLMRKENEPQSYTGQWVYTDMVKTYQLWSDVKGTRVDSYSDDLDILVDAYVDGNTGYLILNNLNFEAVDIDLNLLGLHSNTIDKVDMKQLYLKGDGCEIEEQAFTDAPQTVILESEGTIILKYTFSQDVAINETSTERKYYSDAYLKPIESDKTESFRFSGIEKSQYGEATLRIGIGRIHGKDLKPQVVVNGTKIDVPDNYRGDDQEDRATFFGVLELEIPYIIITENTQVDITFPDNGGHISSVTMQTYAFSREVERSEQIITGFDKLEKSQRIKVYPNPTQGKLNILTNESFIGKPFHIYNQLGKVLRSGTINSFEHQIEMHGLPRGLYFFSLQSDRGEYTQKFLYN